MSDLQLSPRRRKHATAASTASFRRGEGKSTTNLLREVEVEGEVEGGDNSRDVGKGEGGSEGGIRPPVAETATATVWGTTLNLTATAMGAGMLSLPQASAYAGWLVSSISLMVIAVAADFSLVALVVAAETSGKSSVEDISAHYYGTWGLRIARSSLLLLLLGAAVILLVVGVDCLLAPWHLLVCGVWTDSVDGVPQCHAGSSWISTRSALTILCAAIELPLVARPELSRLRFTSLLASAAIAFTTVLVLVKACASMSAQPHSGSSVAQDVSAVPMSAVALMRALPIQGLSFCCQFNILPLYTELCGTQTVRTGTPDHNLNSGGRNIRRVIHFSILGTITLIYLLFGLAGYLGLGGAATPSNILRLDKIQGDVAVRAALALMGATNLLKFPLIFLPLRASLCDIACFRRDQSRGAGEGACENGDDEDDLREPMLSLEAGATTDTVKAGKSTGTCCNHMYMPGHSASAIAFATVSLLLAVCTLALLCSNLSQVFDYVGATAGVLVCYIGPGMLFAASSRTQCQHNQIVEASKGPCRPDCSCGGCIGATAASGYALVGLGIAISVSFFVSICIGQAQ